MNKQDAELVAHLAHHEQLKRVRVVERADGSFVVRVMHDGKSETFETRAAFESWSEGAAEAAEEKRLRDFEAREAMDNSVLIKPEWPTETVNGIAI